MLEHDYRCLDCDYPLRGLPSGSCPECGRDFNWNRPSSYRRAEDPVGVRKVFQGRAKRLGIFIALLTIGQVLVLGARTGAIPWADWCCCCTVFTYPVWILACVIALLAVVSPSGWLGLPGCLLIGCVTGVAIGATAGTWGLVLGLIFGLKGGLIFKYVELNNML